MRLQRSIRWKILFLVITSLFASLISVFILILVALYLSSHISLLYRILQLLDLTIGAVPISILFGIILFLIYFFAFSQRSISYLEEISHNLEKISQGELDIKIPIRAEDEFGVLADNINQMASKLRVSMEEERNAERTKSDLVTSVSHDLRTPLTSILGYLELIVNDRYKDEVELRYYVDIAHNKALSLKSLIDELFEFTRVSYGGIRLNLQKVNMVELMEQLVEEFVPLLQEADMVCKINPVKKEIYARIDGSMMVRVFENLIMNAIRYGKDGKFINIEIKEETYVSIQVKNYGEPIPSKDLPHLFERFYRVEKSRTAETGGTGLGLAIAKNIVELHKGNISAYSSHEETVFEVILEKEE
ncbi:sensor histidine kinase [Alkaliphilus transvaalensis]|uniref:sensor histidine kinase n=1 Tax=Alkaliphilus transvaalensis TaxID=114628 RepID=UPI00047C5C89|nr:HAMP domain-containing histidine kinase [Alkaliphilus transvaalensis]